MLEQGDESVLAKSADAVHALSSLNGCADIALLTATVSLPEDKETRSKIEAVNTRIAEAKALNDAGKYADALKIAEDAAGSARDIAYSPLVAEALRWRGWLLNQTSKYKEGEQSLREAVNAADAGRAATNVAS